MVRYVRMYICGKVERIHAFTIKAITSPHKTMNDLLVQLVLNFTTINAPLFCQDWYIVRDKMQQTLQKPFTHANIFLWFYLNWI